jgi:hypothetical protein
MKVSQYDLVGDVAHQHGNRGRHAELAREP